MKNCSSTFNLKQINQKALVENIKNLKNKNSSGIDGLSQANLKDGAKSLVEPLLNIFNSSIEKSIFPSAWKDAVVTPVHKKGDKDQMSNYRPVSCLPAAAKLLELVICQQTSEYLESNNN